MFVPLLVLSAGCAPEVSTKEVVSVPWSEGCENLNDLYCGFPWPSDRYLEPDPTTVTGLRLAYTPEFIPPNDAGVGGDTFDFEPYRRLDGMSPSTRILTVFDRPADLTRSELGAVPGQDNIGDSLLADSPTVLLDLTTGERVPHWVEHDARADGPEETVLLLHPAGRLVEDHAYAVAIRGLVDADGTALAARPAFAAVRDGLHTDAPDVEARWEDMQALFASLEAAGVPRTGLQSAWRFHTASVDAITGDLRAMRADALDRLGPEGIGCTVSSVEDDYGADTEWPLYRRVRGTFTVPSYMEAPGPGQRLARGADGLPAYQGPDEAPFTLLIPRSLVTPEPRAGRLLAYGHGLLSEGERTVSSDMFRYVADREATVVVATDWVGMSNADEAVVASALVDFSDFVYTTDRLHQSMINFIALSRTFAGVCRGLPELTVDGVSLVDPEQVYFAGGSQGGILGGTLLAVHPDVERGVLLVNGAAFPFLIERSIDFLPLDPIFQQWFPRRIDRAAVLPLAQHLWDHTESAGWLPHLTTGLDELPPKKVLSIVALNDQQVTNLGSDWAARGAGLPLVEGTARTAWGLDTVTAPYDGSGYVTLDLGDRAPPTTNTAADFNDDGHSTICWTESCIEIIDAFLRPDGVVTMPCEGVCDPD